MVILGSYWTLDTDSSSFIQLTTGVGEPETVVKIRRRVLLILFNIPDSTLGFNYHVNPNAPVWA